MYMLVFDPNLFSTFFFLFDVAFLSYLEKVIKTVNAIFFFF